MLNPAVMLGFRGGKERENRDTGKAENVNGFQRFSTFAKLFGRKRKPPEAAVKNEEPWVIGE